MVFLVSRGVLVAEGGGRGGDHKHKYGSETVPVTRAVGRPLRQVTSSAPNSNKCNVPEKGGAGRQGSGGSPSGNTGTRRHNSRLMRRGGTGGLGERQSKTWTTEECPGVSGDRMRERREREGIGMGIGSRQPVKGELNKIDLFQRT